MRKVLLAVGAVAVVAAVAVYEFRPAPANDGGSAGSDAAGVAIPQQAPAQGQGDASQANMGVPFQDTSMLKPPAGAKVAIYEFEDLECPACAQAFPVVRAAAGQYGIPLVRHDYPLTEIHLWSFDAAVTARYLEDKVSPKLADAFRGDVFANQRAIANKDDLMSFTRGWFQSHGMTMPFVMDANGACTAEVKADRAMGDRLGIRSTPCIFVVTQTKWMPVVDVRHLDEIVDKAMADTKAASEQPGDRSDPTLREKAA